MFLLVEFTYQPQGHLLMTVTAINNPVLKIGSTGALVKELQQLLNMFDHNLRVDGIFGKATELAVKDFQTQACYLGVKGIVEHETWKGLYMSVLQAAPHAMPILRRGSTGEAVQWLQMRLSGRAILRDLAVDGDFGPATEAFVKALQKSNHLVVDGIVGSKTWSVLPEMGEE